MRMKKAFVVHLRDVWDSGDYKKEVFSSTEESMLSFFGVFSEILPKNTYFYYRIIPRKWTLTRTV